MQKKGEGGKVGELAERLPKGEFLWHHLCTPKKLGSLDFRKLKGFNMAMLRKQGWRLIQNPNSLISRVFKARYFPRTYLEARLGIHMEKYDCMGYKILSVEGVDGK